MQPCPPEPEVAGKAADGGSVRVTRSCVVDKTDSDYCHIILPSHTWKVLCALESLCRNASKQTRSGSSKRIRDRVFLRPSEQMQNNWQEEQTTIKQLRTLQLSRAQYESNITTNISNNTGEIQINAYFHFIELLERELFQVTELNQEWFQKLNDYAQVIKIHIEDQLKQLKAHDIYTSQQVKNIANTWANFVKQHLVRDIYAFRFRVLRDNHSKKLEDFFANLNIQENPNWEESVHNLINEVESRIKEPAYSEPVALDGTKYRPPNESTEFKKGIERIKSFLYKEAVDYTRDYTFKPVRRSVRNSVRGVRLTANNFMEEMRAVDIQPIYMSSPTPQDYYQAEITDPVKDILRSNHDRRQLSLLNDEAFNKPEEEPYEFQSPEGEFSEKNKSLYSELYEANPFHEQGVYAREIGLAAVQVADEEFAQGNTEEANLAYQIGEGVSDITLGVISYVGTGKDAYEALIGKHLLTGRTLSGFERSMSVVGIALSAMSAGVLSSGHVKLVLNSTESVLSKIRQKLGDPIVRGIQGIQSILKEYPAAFFRKVESMGIRTKEGAKSTLQYLKRVFKGRDPSIEEMENAIESSTRGGAGRASGSTPELPGGGKRAPPPSSTIPSSTEDILKAVESAGGNTQAYRAALREISDLPDSGKEFLANKVFYIFKESGEQLSQAQLVRLGRLYTQYAKAIDIDRLGSVQVNRRVWRFLKKEGVDSSGKTFKNTPEGIFKDHPGMLRSNRRYSASGDWGMYTSLNRNTAIEEAREQYFRKMNVKLTNNQVEELYHFGSREVELDQVLDLTNTDTLRKISNKLTKGVITKGIKKSPNPYELTQMIGHIAKRKGYKGIRVPSAVDNGVNVIIFNKDLL